MNILQELQKWDRAQDEKFDRDTKAIKTFFKNPMVQIGGCFIVGLLVFRSPPPPTVITAEGRAKIAAYKAEEDNYWAVQAKCGPNASGFACDKTLNDLAELEVKHARWTIARDRKFGDFDLEAQWILANKDK